MPVIDRTTQKFLIIPSVPTPNGRLHLGHLGGPYLRADMLARYWRSLGHQAIIMAGTDPYESFVSLQAVKEKCPPSELAQHYHGLIAQDLNRFNIGTTEFVNPLEKHYSLLYTDWHRRIFTELANKKVLRSQNESVVWDENHQRFITGCWLNGNCPYCEQAIVGYFCEQCGAHFKPQDVKQSVNTPNSSTQLVNAWFLLLANTLPPINSGISPEIIQQYQLFLSNQHQLFRLSCHAQWGVPLPEKFSLAHNTFFNYGMMYSYFLMMGDLAQKTLGLTQNAFAKDSKVTTVVTFGFDNAIPFLASILGITTHLPHYQAFNSYVVNYFYYLDGSKFSTSRQHAVWVNDLDQKTPYITDITRLYLALIDVSENIGHFNLMDYQRFCTETAAWITQTILYPLENKSINKLSTVTGKLSQQFLGFWKVQQIAFDRQHFRPDRAALNLLHWQQIILRLKDNNNQYTWALAAFAVLAYPLMPTLSQHIWQKLGLADIPAVAIIQELQSAENYHEIS